MIKGLLKNVTSLLGKRPQKDACLYPGIWVVNDLLTKEECADLIKKSEANGYKRAHQFDEGRHNMEAFIREEMMGFSLMDKLKAHLFTCESVQFHITDINRPLEFYKYETGGYIKRHSDAHHELSGGKKTALTLVLYLNSDYAGGDTLFPNQNIKISPITGAGLLFNQKFSHEASLVTSGTKYVLRTDCVIE